MKARMSEKLRKLLSHPEEARALQKALAAPRCVDPVPREIPSVRVSRLADGFLVSFERMNG